MLFDKESANKDFNLHECMASVIKHINSPKEKARREQVRKNRTTLYMGANTIKLWDEFWNKELLRLQQKALDEHKQLAIISKRHRP